MCADCPTSCEEKDPICQAMNSGGRMASQTEPDAGHRGEGVCQRGCGLLLSGEDLNKGGHCCVDALRTVTDALEERSAALEHEARMARLRWNRREQVLLAQVSTLQNEAQLAALKYQRRLHQYMLHINSIAEQVIGYYKSDLRTTADIQSHISGEATCADGEPQEQVKAPE
ncbi:PDZ domain-containing RING finger protein 4-like isoform X1, partial [Lates japonicus]